MSDQRSLGEFGRIARFFRPLAAGSPGAFDLTDDAAAIAVPAGHELVVTTDAIVAGIHFFPTDDPGDIARKALRVNLSDLAAKGAQPFAYTLTLALGRDISDGWVEAFAAALAEDQAEFDIGLIGGDSVSTEGPIWISVTAFGLVQVGRMVRRSGAKPGDLVFVTGTIGDAALGLRVLQGRDMPEADRQFVIARYLIPEPRSPLTAAVAEYASAALDVSDGLAADFGHLCAASGVTGILESARVPLSSAARRAIAQDPDIFSTVLTGGDDYEILLTATPGRSPALIAAAEAVGVALTEIGRIEAGAGRVSIPDSDGKPVKLAKAGWTHA
jgi:thiamine-monophosphate kinase